MNYRSYADLNEIIKKNIGKFQEYDLIVGIPRSGMIPAYIFALLLNKQCTDLQSLLDNRSLQHGSSRPLKKNFSVPSEASKILLVDDSILTGEAMQKIYQSFSSDIREKITTVAIYSSRKQRDDIDLYLEFLQHPRIFEWNIFHHNILVESCVDIDGVLCADPTERQNDDGDNYRDFLLNAEPYIIPTAIIDSLVTNRLEKYRPETEAWLERHKVRYKKLIMLDLPSMEERQRLGVHSTHKADYYRKSKLPFFVESCPRQARNISELTKKPVYCVENNFLYKPGAIFGALTTSEKTHVYILRKAAAYLPSPVYKAAKSFYRQYIVGNKTRRGA